MLADDHHADECDAQAAARTDTPHHRAILKLIDRWRSDAERLRQQALVDRDGAGRASTEIAPGIRKI